MVVSLKFLDRLNILDNWVINNLNFVRLYTFGIILNFEGLFELV